MSKVFVGLLATFLAMFANAATIECLDGGFRLIGKIEAGDYQRLIACHKNDANEKNSDTRKMLVISSPGGSVEEAMKIGEYTRENKFWVVVPPERGVCLSSCVYVLAAGVVKMPLGKVGIHRPYFEVMPNMGYESGLRILLDRSRSYFRDMNIPEFLADDMFSTPPNEIQFLGNQELRRYRLDQNDIAYEEENANTNAAHYGLTRQEYMRRLSLSEKYMDECLATVQRPASTADVVHCGNASRKKAGLIPKN